MLKWRTPPPGTTGSPEQDLALLRQWLVLQEDAARPSAPQMLPWILAADLPPAADHDGDVFYISDENNPAYSDGTTWVRY